MAEKDYLSEIVYENAHKVAGDLLSQVFRLHEAMVHLDVRNVNDALSLIKSLQKEGSIKSSKSFWFDADVTELRNRTKSILGYIDCVKEKLEVLLANLGVSSKKNKKS